MTTQFRAGSQSQKIVKFRIFLLSIILNCQRTIDLMDVPSFYDRKTASRRFYTIHDILRSLRLVQSLLKGWNASIWHFENRGVKEKLYSNFILSLGNDGADQQAEYDQSTSDSGNGNRAGSESRIELIFIRYMINWYW